MGARGPAPKPAALGKLEGAEKRRIGREPELPKAPGTWEAPAHLNGEAKREWKRLVKPLTRIGLLTVADRDAFATYCVWHARHVEAEWQIKRLGMTTTTPNGLVQTSAWVTISKHASELKKSLAAELGLTPAGRARMGRAFGTLADTPEPETGNEGNAPAQPVQAGGNVTLFGKQ